MKLQRVKIERADHLQSISNGSLSWKIIDGAIKGLDFDGPDGRIFVDIDSYQITVSEAARKNVFYLGFFADIPGDKVFIEKHFDEEYERDAFIRENLRDYEESSLVVDKREIIEA